MKTRARIFLVDEQPVVRVGVRHCLSQQPDWHICGEADDGPTTLQALRVARPHLILLGLRLAHSSALDLIKDIRAQHAAVRVLVYTAAVETDWAKHAFHAGTHGYLQKREPVENLLKAITAVLRGECYISQEITNRLAATLVQRRGTRHSPWEHLSDREWEVMTLFGDGKSLAAIARQLHVGKSTAQTHSDRLKEKFGVPDQAALVQLAIEHRLRRAVGRLGESALSFMFYSAFAVS